MLLSGWERGETVELEVDYRITEEFFCGEGVYEEGRYHQIIFAEVKSG